VVLFWRLAVGVWVGGSWPNRGPGAGGGGGGGGGGRGPRGLINQRSL
jgi:hypothetical protein